MPRNGGHSQVTVTQKVSQVTDLSKLSMPGYSKNMGWLVRLILNDLVMRLISIIRTLQCLAMATMEQRVELLELQEMLRVLFLRRISRVEVVDHAVPRWRKRGD